LASGDVGGVAVGPRGLRTTRIAAGAGLRESSSPPDAGIASSAGGDMGTGLAPALAAASPSPKMRCRAAAYRAWRAAMSSAGAGALLGAEEDAEAGRFRMRSAGWLCSAAPAAPPATSCGSGPCAFLLAGQHADGRAGGEGTYALSQTHLLSVPAEKADVDEDAAGASSSSSSSSASQSSSTRGGAGLCASMEPPGACAVVGVKRWEWGVCRAYTDGASQESDIEDKEDRKGCMRSRSSCHRFVPSPLSPRCLFGALSLAAFTGFHHVFSYERLWKGPGLARQPR
jgi:hypothetical protein